MGKGDSWGTILVRVEVPAFAGVTEQKKIVLEGKLKVHDDEKNKFHGGNSAVLRVAGVVADVQRLRHGKSDGS